MKKTKKEIGKIDGKIYISNGVTNLIGFKTWREAREFLKKFL